MGAIFRSSVFFPFSCVASSFGQLLSGLYIVHPSPPTPPLPPPTTHTFADAFAFPLVALAVAKEAAMRRDEQFKKVVGSGARKKQAHMLGGEVKSFSCVFFDECVPLKRR